MEHIEFGLAIAPMIMSSWKRGIGCCGDLSVGFANSKKIVYWTNKSNSLKEHHVRGDYIYIP